MFECIFTIVIAYSEKLKVASCRFQEEVLSIAPLLQKLLNGYDILSLYFWCDCSIMTVGDVMVDGK